MKKNWKGFLFVVFVFLLSTLIFVGVPLGWWGKEPSEPFATMILFWLIQIISAMAVGEQKEKLQPKPNYKCSEIKDENFFKIISIAANFDRPIEKEGHASDYMHVDLHNFGETLILFPLNKYSWHGGYPKPGQVWAKKGNIFILLIQKNEKK